MAITPTGSSVYAIIDYIAQSSKARCHHKQVLWREIVDVHVDKHHHEHANTATFDANKNDLDNHTFKL